MKSKDQLKPVEWVGSSLEDLRGFPEDVQDEVGFAIYQAQRGGKHASAKALRGFAGAGILEVFESYDGNAYRTVYTVKFRSGSTCCMCFRKNQRKESKLHNRKSI